MLGCLRFRRKIGARLDAALPDAQAYALARHLDACDRCQAEARSHERVRTLLRSATVSLPAPPDPDEFWSGVRAKILGTAPPPRRVLRAVWPRWSVGWVPRVAVAGASALVLALVLWQGLAEKEAPLPGVVVRTLETEYPVMVLSTPEQDMTVIWVFGLGSTPDQSLRLPPGLGPSGALVRGFPTPPDAALLHV